SDSADSASTTQVTIWWSPPSWHSAMRPSMCAAAPSRAGAPCGVGDQATPANLSLPLRANASLSSCCPALSTLTHRYGTVASSGQDVEVFDGQNSTIGGVSDNAVKDWEVSPPRRASG